MKIIKAFNLWFTGLPSSGKTSTAIYLKEKLKSSGISILLMDGDEVRKGLSADLGFSDKDREENNRRIIHITGMIVNQGIPVATTFISPFTKTRRFARSIIPGFIEVYINTPLEICIKRDVKGLYKKALKGEIKRMTGIDDKYEAPQKPEIELNTNKENIGSNCDQIIKYLLKEGFLID